MKTGMEPGAGDPDVHCAFTWDRWEHRAAQTAAMRYGPLWRRPAVAYPAAIAAGLLVLPATRLLHGVVHLPIAPIAGSVLALASAIVSLIYVRRLHEATTRHEQGRDECTLSDTGLEISTADDLVLLSWPNMTRIHETREFFLFVAGSEVEYIPKRVLTPPEVGQVQALIRRHAPHVLAPDERRRLT